jgi:rhomboid family protein
MRRQPFRIPWSVTLVIMLVNIAAFLGQMLAGRFTNFPVLGYFALSTDGLRHGYVWQLVSYMFLHGGWLHLLFNCWAIFVFGRDVETALGRKSFVALYFASGIIGGLVQALAGALFGGVFAEPVVGASAGAFGLVSAFAMLFPERPLMLLLFFIVPLSMRAKFLLLFEAALAVLGLFVGPFNIANAAHLGGMLTGIVFVRYAMNWHWPQLKRAWAQPTRRLVTVQPRVSAGWGHNRASTAEDLPPEEFLAKQVDPILDKISAHGIQSLTARERRILETARQKMGRR